MATCADELYRAADIALYRAKDQGRNKVVMFDEGMFDQTKRDWLIYQK
jgi:diguanylate cyclase